MNFKQDIACGIFAVYVVFGPAIYAAGKTQVSGLSYVRYEISQPIPAPYELFRPSTQVNSGFTAAFIVLTSSL